MSTETQFGNVDDAISGFRTLANFGRGSSMTGALHDACDLLEKMQLTQSSQAAEMVALKEKLASYEAHGVTCQTFGHVVGACAECNTHEESKEAEIAALKADIATYVQMPRLASLKMLDAAWGICGDDGYAAAQPNPAKVDAAIKAYARLIDAAMQTKEAS